MGATRVRGEGPSGAAPPRLHWALLGSLVGLAFAVTESCAALLWPAPLDEVPSVAALVGSAAGLAALHALAAGWAGRRGLVGAVTVWCLVWAFEGPRSAGENPLWGGLAVGVVVLSARFAAGSARPLFRTAAWALLLSVVGAGWVPAWRPRPVPAAPLADFQGDPPDILLVTVDTVRADHHLLDPWIGQPGWEVLDAVSAAPWTLPALHSLFAGLPVHSHGGGLPGDGGWSLRSPSARSHVWALAEAGYTTHAVVSNPHLSPDQGFADGFQHWLHFASARGPLVLLHNLAGMRRRHTGWPEPWRWTRDDALVRAAAPLLGAAAARPRFVWVHLFSPHEYGRTAESPPAEWEPGTREPAALRAAYAGNIAATQARLKELVADKEDWVVAITSDHGEALGEEGRWGHGHHLDAAELRVPLALHVPAAVPAELTGPPGLLSTVDLLPALTRVAAGQPLTLPRHAEVAVGGLRDEARFGRFQPDGTTRAQAPPVLQQGRLATPDRERRGLLESLGYVVPEGN